jgi:hypothetical protein
MFIPALAAGSMIPPLLLIWAMALIRKVFRGRYVNHSSVQSTPCEYAPCSLITSSEPPVLSSTRHAHPKVADGNATSSTIVVMRGRMDLKKALSEIRAQHMSEVEIPTLVGGEV